jgi:polysaccharide biosynthesis/export protein
MLSVSACVGRAGDIALLAGGYALLSPTIGRVAAFALASCFFVTNSLPVRGGEYLLRAGDVLELTAVGLPDLRQKIVIGPDGLAFFPLLGPVQVADSTLKQVRSQIQAMLPQKVYRRRSPDGRDDSIVLSPDEINVIIAEYRPVYLNGDVGKPGEQPYRPGMTVHQAIAMAGGYEIMRFRMNNPFLEAADFRHELTAVQIDYARQTAYVQRLQAEIDGKASAELNSAAGAREAPLVSIIRRAEADQLRLRQGDTQKETAYLGAAIQSVKERIDKLTEQQSKERDGTAADLDEFGRVRDLMQRGMVPTNRVSDARRMALLSSTSLLQTGAMRGQAIRERQDLERRLQQLPDTKRMEQVRELETAQVELAKLESRIRAVQQKLAYTGILRSQLAAGDSPKLTIFRDNAGGRERIDAAESSLLEPGDLVEVAIRTDFEAMEGIGDDRR